MLKQLQDMPNTSRICFTRSKTVYEYDLQFKKEKEKTLTDIHKGVA